MDEKWIVCTQLDYEDFPGVFSTHHNLEAAKAQALELARLGPPDGFGADDYKEIVIQHWVFTVRSGWVNLPQDRLFINGKKFESLSQRLRKERTKYLNMNDGDWDKKIHREEIKERAKNRRRVFEAKETPESVGRAIASRC